MRTAVRRLVGTIPPGRVSTYGAVAAAAGHPGAARAVGGILRGMPDDVELPWWRVVGAGGRITIPPGPAGMDRLQRRLLEDEGVTFDPSGRVDMARFSYPLPV